MRISCPLKKTVHSLCNMVKRCFLLPMLLQFFYISACEQNEQEVLEAPIGELFTPQRLPLTTTYSLYFPQAKYAEAQAACQDINLKGKSIAFIGGSLSCRKESKIMKEMLYVNLGAPDIYTYGHGGFGFATTTGSFQNLVTVCRPHDIYFLWCSTNDYGTGVPVGDPSDYTEADSFAPNRRSTQCGGMNACIQYLRHLNPKAQIIGITSLPFFGSNASRKDGFLEDPSTDNGQGITFYKYIQKQRLVFEQQDIPYLYLWDMNIFTITNFMTFYLDDGFHLSHAGYFVLGCEVLRFLCQCLTPQQND